MTQAAPTAIGGHDEQGWRDMATRFDAVVEAISDWEAPSPCAAWSARDVLQHVMSTQRDFLAGHGYPLEVGLDGSVDPALAWREHDSAVRRLLADPDVAQKAIDGFFGPTTIGATLLRFYGFDLLVHRWDIARSAGRDERFDEAELTTIESAIDGFGEHLYAEGICQPALEVSSTAHRQTRLLARMGRSDSVR